MIFGGADLTTVRLKDLGTLGFVIEGASEDDYSSEATTAGDVNGDGLDDILVGGSGVDNNGRTESGSAYVVFGKTTNETVHLSEFDTGVQGAQGFRIDGASQRDLAGEDVAGLGDVNGDGLDDLAVGAPFADNAYVVFGKTNSLPVDLLLFNQAVQGSAGFRIDLPSTSRDYGYSVAGAGDFNDDGTPDVVLGVVSKPGSLGSAYVVFGKSSSGNVDVSEADGLSIRFEGRYSGSATGFVVAGGGDVNGDSVDDVIIGAPGLLVGSYGEAFVVFGTANPVPFPLAEIGDRGFRIKGSVPRNATQGEGLGQDVASLGDVNGDGLMDLGLGAPAASIPGRIYCGAVYVIYGKKDSTTVRTRRLGSGGYRILGARTNHTLFYVSGLGDVDGDTRRDFLVGAPGVGGAYKSRIDDPGAVYVIESASR